MIIYRRPESIEEVSRRIDELRTEIAGIVQTVSDMAKARGQVASNAVQLEGSRLNREGEKQFDHLQSRAENMAHQARDVVREQPTAFLMRPWWAAPRPDWRTRGFSSK